MIMINNQKGLTLLEVLIALLILTIMTSAIFGAFIASARMDMSSKSFSEARSIAQTQIERIHNNSTKLSYSDTLYQLITVDGFSCTGFSYSTDLVTGSILYSTPDNTVTCTKNNSSFNQTIIFTRDNSITIIEFIQIKIVVQSNNPSVKRYETLYATEFKS